MHDEAHSFATHANRPVYRAATKYRSPCARICRIAHNDANQETIKSERIKERKKRIREYKSCRSSFPINPLTAVNAFGDFYRTMIKIISIDTFLNSNKQHSACNLAIWQRITSFNDRRLLQ